MFGSPARPLGSGIPRHLLRSCIPRRPISFRTPPSQRPRSWRNSTARWGLALGALYYLNTSELASEQMSELRSRLLDAIRQNEQFATLNKTPVPALDAPSPSTSPANSSAASAATLRSSEPVQESPSPDSASSRHPQQSSSPVSNDPGDPQELEDEAEGEGAFNPETGEINWDCPCLGGMAHGPCGPDFREAFSCFVYSKEEPKGINCIDRFKNMQDCFRQHPDVYAAELSDDPDSDALGAPIDDEPQSQPQAGSVTLSGDTTAQDRAPGANLTPTPSASPTSLSSSTDIPSSSKSKTEAEEAKTTERAKKATQQVKKEHGDESARRHEDIVPKAWHDATEKEQDSKASQ